MPFFAFPPGIRKMIYTTNAVEALHRSLRKIIKTRGSFPNDDAALKLLYLAIRNPGCAGDARSNGPPRWASSQSSSASASRERRDDERHHGNDDDCSASPFAVKSCACGASLRGFGT